MAPFPWGALPGFAWGHPWGVAGWFHTFEHPVDVLPGDLEADAQHGQAGLACGIGPANLQDVGLGEFFVLRVGHGSPYLAARIGVVSRDS